MISRDESGILIFGKELTSVGQVKQGNILLVERVGPSVRMNYFQSCLGDGGVINKYTIIISNENIQIKDIVTVV
jgi:hypothetical protein